MAKKVETNDYAAYLFHQGTNYHSYDFMGSHYTEEGVTFRTWAPRAQAISVIGDFNGWDFNANPMTRVNDQGLYECFIPEVSEFAAYKYAIIGADGNRCDKCDPYAFHSATRPKTAS